MRRRLLILLATAPTMPTEFGLALAAAGWGFWLVLPWDSFGLSRSYTAMRDIAPDAAWGAVIFLVGIAHLYVVLSEQVKRRQAMAYVSVITWAFVAAMFALGDYRTTAVVIYGLLALAAGWVAVRLGVGGG